MKNQHPRPLRQLAACVVTLVTLAAGVAGAQGPSIMNAYWEEVLQGEGYTTLVVSPTGMLREDGVEGFSIPMARGMEYAFFAMCDNDCSDVDLIVLGPDGREVAADRDADDSPTIRMRATATGTHTLRVSMASCSVEPCEFWVRGYSKGSAASGGATSNAGQPCTVSGTQLTLAQGGSVSGSLSARDCVRADDSYARYYRLVLPARDSVTITMTADDFDAYLVLLDSRGETVSSDDDGADGTNARIDTTLAAGTYYVVANTLESGDTGTYRLSVSRRRMAAMGGSSTTTAGAIVAGQRCTVASTQLSIAQGESVSGTLGARDCKRGDDSYARYYRLVVPARESVTITMTSDDFDTFLVLQDSDGDDVEVDDDGEGGTDSRIERVLAPGTYYVIANSLSSGSTGAYRLRVSPRAASSTGGSSTTTAGGVAGQPCSVAGTQLSIAQGESVSGTLSTRDCKRDDNSYARYYRLVLPARDSVTITMTSGEFDTYLVIQDAEGREVESDDDGAGDGETDSRIDRVLPAGTYYVIANSLFASGTGAFQLRVSPRRRGGQQ